MPSRLLTTQALAELSAQGYAAFNRELKARRKGDDDLLQTYESLNEELKREAESRHRGPDA